MPGTLFFVHGTGVRDEGFKRSKEAIAKGVTDVGLADVTILGTSWGEALGVRLERLKDVLPPEISTKSVGYEVSPLEVEAAAWAQLLIDPLFELRIAGSRQGATKSMPLPGIVLPEQEAVLLLGRLPAGIGNISQYGITPDQLKRAADQVAASANLSKRQEVLTAPRSPIS